MTLRRVPRRRMAGMGLLASITVASAACAWAPGRGAAGPDTISPDTSLVPPGYGTLRQDQVTLSLRRADLLIKVTPMAESVIRLTAPDTYARLAELKRSHSDALRRRAPVDDPALLLVSFFSYEPNIPFQPEDVHLLNRGLRFRPLAIDPVTPGWGIQRLDQEETQMAIYAYDPTLDLSQEIAVEYREARRGGWDQIISLLEAERARVLARSRVDAGAR